MHKVDNAVCQSVAARIGRETDCEEPSRISAETDSTCCRSPRKAEQSREAFRGNLLLFGERTSPDRAFSSIH